MITLDSETIKIMSLFAHITKRTPRDCIVLDDRIFFIVAEGDIGSAIGKQGAHVKLLRNKLRKNVHIIELSKNAVGFIRNVFASHNVKNVVIEEKGGKKYASVAVPLKDKARAIGPGAKNLKLSREIVKRYFDIESITITTA
jgi:N utilization substance protein A